MTTEFEHLVTTGADGGTTIGGQTRPAPYDSTDDETAAFFEHTIAEWRCNGCGTEFTVDSVYAMMRTRPLSCPVCTAGEDVLTRMRDHPERRGGDDE